MRSTSVARLRAGLVALAVATPLAAGCSAPDAGSDNPAGVLVSTPGSTSAFHGTELAEPYHKPSAVFTAMDGSSFRIDRDARRPVVLVFFGYTSCPDICSTVLADVAAALRPLPPVVHGKVELLFVTTDPVRDTGPVMQRYLGRFDPTFVGLRASEDRTERVAETLGVAITGRDPVGSGYTVTHGAQVIGFGPDDLAHVIWMPGTPVADLRADVERLASTA